MSISEMKLVSVGSPSTNEKWQHAAVTMQFGYNQGNLTGHLTFNLHVARGEDLTMGDIAADAERQIKTIAAQIVEALESKTLQQWDNEGRQALV